jgi:hypothetical protein
MSMSGVDAQGNPCSSTIFSSIVQPHTSNYSILHNGILSYS